MKRHFVISFAIISLVFLSLANLSYAALAGKISLLQGRVDVLKSGRNAAAPVKAGDIVDVGDIYRAKSDGKAEITFINGNILKIASNTRAEIKEAMFEGEKSSNVIKLHRGRVQAISSDDFIKKVSAFAEGNKFEVHTPNAVAGIRGSNMIVSFLQRTTGTIFIAGKGYQFNPNDPKKKIVAITAGNISFITSATGSPTIPRRASEAEIAIQVNAMTMFNTGDDTTGASLDTKSPTIAYTPTNILQPPAPLPPPEPTPETTTSYTGSLAAGMFYDDNFVGSGNMAASMAGSIANNANIGSANVTGNYDNPNSYKIWSSDFDGTTSKNGAYLGYAGGSWTSWSGNAIGLYVENGQIGFLTSSPSGDSADGSATGSGQLVKRLIGPTTLTQAEGQTLLDALKDANNVTTETFTTTDQGAWSIGEALFSAAKHKIDTKTVKPELVGGKSIGVIREMLSGNSYDNPTHATQNGVYGERVNDSYYSIGMASLADEAAHNKLTMNISNIYMTTQFQGTQNVYYEGTYDALGSAYRMVGIGTTEGAPLNHVSKVPAGRFQGLFGGTESIWTSTDPAHLSKVIFMGKLAASGGSLDVHGATYSGTDWTNLLPGNVQHVFSLDNNNYVADASHPITQGVNSPVTSNFASHGYFTNLLAGTTTFFKDSSDNPTGIEYRYNGGRVVASMQTLEWPNTDPTILSNTISYITPGGGKVLLLQDANPWGSTRNNTTLNNLGISYDIKTASEFASLDLSPYSTIIIASVQSQSFYDTIAANINKLESFVGSASNNVGLSQIFSYDYVNNRPMTYDGGAYRGLIGTVKNMQDQARAEHMALYIDPDGNGGVFSGNLSGNVYANADNMFLLNGNVYKQQIKTAAELGINPQDLYNSTSVGTMNGTGTYFEGFFTNWQQITGQEGSGYTMAIKNNDTHEAQNWGIYGVSFQGTYTDPTTAAWTGRFGGHGSFGEYYNNGAWVADSGYWLAQVDNGVWGSWIEGTGNGRFITRKKLGSYGVNAIGTFNPNNNSWEMAINGIWNSVPLKFWSNVETPFVYFDAETNALRDDGGMAAVMGGATSLADAAGQDPAHITILGKYTAGSQNNQRHVWTANINSYNWDDNSFTTMDGWGAYKGYGVGTRIDTSTAGKFFAVYIDIGPVEATYNAGILFGDHSGTIYPNAKMLEMDGGIYRVEMDQNITTPPQNLMESITSYPFASSNYFVNSEFMINDNPMGDLYGRPYQYDGEFISIDGLQWGIWHNTLGGKYTGLDITDAWTAFLKHVHITPTNGADFIIGQYTAGTLWNPGDNRIEGSTFGYGADLATGSTWITVGETMGTFNPTAQTFQTVSIGVGINAERYLSMTDTDAGRATLNSLNVPCVQVGSVNLAQNGENPNLSSVAMNGVRFFGTASGEAPRIWATNNVSGNYTGNPLNQTVGLSGGGLTAQFTMRGWDTTNSKWMSGISGSGNLSGGSYTGSVQIRGAGAGSINQGAGSFSGTAAGASRAGGAQ